MPQQWITMGHRRNLLYPDFLFEPQKNPPPRCLEFGHPHLRPLPCRCRLPLGPLQASSRRAPSRAASAAAGTRCEGSAGASDAWPESIHQRHVLSDLSQMLILLKSTRNPKSRYNLSPRGIRDESELVRELGMKAR